MRFIHEGIVFLRVPYKDNDLIVSILTVDNNIISFKARGALKLNSKLAYLCQLYTKGEFVLEGKSESSNKVLIEGKVDKFPLELFSDLKSYTLLGLISSFINKFNEEINFYELLNFILLNSEKFDSLTATIYFLNLLIKLNGVELYVDGCRKCKSKKINYLVYDEGGFYCDNCFNGNYYINDLTYLRTFRILSKVQLNNLLEYKVEREIGIKIFIDLVNYLEKNVGIYINNIEMLKKIF